MIEGIRIATKLAGTEVFQEKVLKTADFPLPACNNFSFGSEKYWKIINELKSFQFKINK